MDDTIAALEEAVYEYMLENYGDEGWAIHPNDRNGYALSEQYDDEFGEHVGDIVRAFQRSPGFFLNMKPIKGSIEAIHEMMDEGIDVVFCSTPYRLSLTVRDEKAKWISKYFPEGSYKDWLTKLVLTHRKYDQYGHFLIDDSPHMTRKPHTKWKQIFAAKKYNEDCSPRLEDWSKWRDVVYPILREQGFKMVDGQWGKEPTSKIVLTVPNLPPFASVRSAIEDFAARIISRN